MIVGIISGNMPYVLSALGCDPVESLGKVWVAGIVAVCLGYFVRGFKDTKSIADDDYRRMVMEQEAYDSED